MREWFTPPQVARARSLRVSKVLHWIATGELMAVNHAQNRLGRPRWRISASALEAFDRARSNRAVLPIVAPQRSRYRDPAVQEFF